MPQWGAMSGFLFAMLAVLIAGLGARDQLLVAGMVHRQGARRSTLVVALACGVLTAGAAALAAARMGSELGGPMRQLLAALALGLAGVELLFARQIRLPDEPTDSLGALALVLLAQQLTDAARFMVFAIAVAVDVPWAAGLGGALGAAGVAMIGWFGAADLAALPLTAVRRSGGAVLVLAALALGLAAL